MFVDLTWLAVVAALFTGAPLAATTAQSAAPAQASRAAVVAELFTSEGCSSCPPADELLSDLVRNQPMPGVEVIGLAEHVDYWDHLGWRDPFSSSAFSARQADYGSRVFRTRSIYTPQLVVDGQLETAGSDAGSVARVLRRAAQLPKAQVVIGAVAQPDRRDARIEVTATLPTRLALRDRADVVVAIVEDNLITEVRRGENGGRTLKHTAVVRSLTTIGALTQDERTWSGTASVSLGSAATSENVRAVAFLQERSTRRIVGAATTRVAREAGH